ncbi:MAG: hypothetical protein ABIB47_00030 [Candidatus Woesearchaeota archaeon]
MNNKVLGMVLILLAVGFIAALVIFKIQVNDLTESLMIQSGGSCIQDGKCLHEQSNIPMYLGLGVILVTLVLGVYLLFFERGQKYIEKTHKELIGTLEKAEKSRDEDERFDILLKGLDDYEKKALVEVKKQPGIMQNTLRLRTDMSKAKLSIVLTELERRGLVKKISSGKTNKIYLKIGV